MVDVTQKNAAQDDAAFVDAYERRISGGRAEDVPAVWREEIEQMLAIHERISAIALPEVSPAVRSVVLTAAAQVAAQRPVSTWSRIAEFLFKPGPVLVLGTAAALLVAVGVRENKQPPMDAGAVAVLDGEAPAAQAGPEPERPAEPLQAAAAEAKAAPSESAVQQPAAPPVATAAAPAPKAQAEYAAAAPAPPSRLLKAIAAQPASLGPDSPAADKPQQAAVADELGNAQPPLQAIRMDQLAGRENRAPPAPVVGMARVDSAKVQDSDDAGRQEFAAKDAPQKENQAQAAHVYAAPSQKKAAAEESAEQKVAPSVAQLRAEAEKTTDPVKRVAALTKLRAAALQAGDGKTAQWAEQMLAKNAQNSGSGGVPAKAKAAPESRSAPASAPASQE